MRFQLQNAKMGELVARGAAPSVPAGYVLERKMDGMRAVFEIGHGETLIFSRTGQDLRPQFPELCRLHEILEPCVIDGEIVALGPDGVENLELLQLRLGDKKARRMAEVPVTVRFFDCLECGGADIRGMALSFRRAALEEIVGPDFLTEMLPVGEQIPLEWEGVIAKRASSPYSSGKRISDWLKFKFVERATLRATGLTAGKNARAGSFGAVTVSDANGVPRGQVGSGFTASDIERMMAFAADGEWPLVEVEYRFLSKTGLLVNTAFKGFRTDKEEADVL